MALQSDAGLFAFPLRNQPGRVMNAVFKFDVAAVRAFLDRRIARDDRLLIAVSGGADSMALLALLMLEFGFSVSRLVVGHVQHGMRSATEQYADLAAIRNFTEGHEIQVISRSVDAPALARTARLSLEAAARRLRYQALAQIAADHRCHWILTGHTLDDSAETVLMRLRSGAPWYECTGIPPQRGLILRPLLSVSRNKLKSWIVEAGIPFREDTSNIDPHFARNCLRLQLSRHPEFWTAERIQSMAATGEALRTGIVDLKRLSKCLPLGVIPVGFPPRIGLAIDEIFRYFNKLNFIPVEVAWAGLMGDPALRLSSLYRRQVASFLHGHSPCARQSLPGDISLLRDGTHAWLYREAPILTPLRVHTGRTLLPDGRGSLTVEPGYRTYSPESGSVALHSRFALDGLWVRPWKPGERLQARGRPVKKIADLLVEQGVDAAARPHVLILADDAGPVMIPSGAVAARALPSPDDTQVTWIDWKAYDATGTLHAL